jgi:hypothetical protein
LKKGVEEVFVRTLISVQNGLKHSAVDFAALVEVEFHLLRLPGGGSGLIRIYTL